MAYASQLTEVPFTNLTGQFLLFATQEMPFFYRLPLSRMSSSTTEQRKILVPIIEF
jgi:hypothetical protein